MQLCGAGSRSICFRHLLLVLALGVLVASDAAALTLTVQDQSVGANGTVVVPMTVADALDVGAIDVVLVFDPAVLRFVSAEPAPLIDRGRISWSEAGPGRVALAIAIPRSLTGSGPIAALTFASTGAAGRARAAIGLEAATAVTVDGDAVPVQVTNGTVSVGGGPGTPLSPFAAAGALACVAALSYGARRRRRR